MTKQLLTDAEILAQGRTALQREQEDRAAGLRADAVWYDHASGYIMMTLTNHRLFGVRVRDIPYLAKATVPQLSSVELSPGGDGLHWESLNVDLSVPGLILETIGRSELVKAWARAAGRVKTPARAKASRANGAKGGRPRKRGAE